MREELPIYIAWMDYLKWVLSVTEKFPKTVRYTFVDRIQNLVLSVTEEIVEARYSSQKTVILRRLNLNLEKIRILMRISYEQKYLSHKAYEHNCRCIAEVGKMVGGWIRSQ